MPAQDALIILDVSRKDHVGAEERPGVLAIQLVWFLVSPILRRLDAELDDVQRFHCELKNSYTSHTYRLSYP